MSLKIACALVALLGLWISSLAALVAGHDMASRVNEHRPYDQRLFFGRSPWLRSKGGPVLREYRRLYQEGPLLRRLSFRLAVAALCFAVFVSSVLWAGATRPS